MKKKMNKTAGHSFREIKETNKEKNNSEFNTHKRVLSLRSTTTGGGARLIGLLANLRQPGNWLACSHYFPVNLKIGVYHTEHIHMSAASDQSRVREQSLPL